MLSGARDAIEAAAVLEQGLADLAETVKGYSSGSLRLECPLPASCHALGWLHAQAPAPGTRLSPSCLAAWPRVYFSPRSSPAGIFSSPGTEAAQGGALNGEGAAAALGAAVLWRGAPGHPRATSLVLD